MKKLFLVRHAKSDWENTLLLDIERPLNQRGYSNAHLMSKRLLEMPDLIYTSPAVRAVSTALIFARNLHYPTNSVIIKEELYESTVKQYLLQIQQAPESCQLLMFFGHNPLISETVYLLTGSLPMELPTCGIAGISFNIPKWQDAKANKGELFLLDYPKKII